MADEFPVALQTLNTLVHLATSIKATSEKIMLVMEIKKHGLKIKN